MIFSLALCMLLGAAGAFTAAFAQRTIARRLRNPKQLRRGWLIGGAAVTALSFTFIVLCALHSVAELACTAALAASVLALAALAAWTISLRIHTAPASRPRRILAIGAHPDDLELACGGTMAKLADAGHEIHALVMSDGAQGGERDIRVGEARRGAEFMGLASIEVHEFPDTALADCGNSIREVIEAAIKDIEPDIIFTHSAHDQHQDHHAVHLATLRAARFHHSILCYESPSTTREFNPSFFVDIDDYVGTKVHAVLTHRNQAGKPYMTPERVEGMAVFRGGQAKGSPAEAFEPVRLAASSLGVLY